VASVVPERRAVLLKLDRRTLSSTLAAPDAPARTPPSAEEGAEFSDEWRERVARYVSAGESDADRANADRADAASKPSVESAGPERSPTGADRQPAPEPAQRDRATTACHLLFVSTSRGYALVEREGPPPPLGQGIAFPEQPDSFRVAKLGPSPLPNDRRICAYLERTE
jgi:hypothetical protein